MTAESRAFERACVHLDHARFHLEAAAEERQWRCGTNVDVSDIHRCLSLIAQVEAACDDPRECQTFFGDREGVPPKPLPR